jgi:hypothetical protein
MTSKYIRAGTDQEELNSSTFHGLSRPYIRNSRTKRAEKNALEISTVKVMLI